jgi:NADH-quinone oxidoreductase subunit L
MLEAKLAIFLPLISTILSSFFVRKKNNILLQYLCSFLIAVASGYSFILYSQIVNSDIVIVSKILNWINIGELNINWEIQIDSLAVTMLVVINLVSAIVHFYSIGYMRGEKRVNRFICYLSLFTFFMIILVTAANLLQLFVGWEGVGLCSYLLIGFWFKKESANKASLKAFITNRIGDFAFIIGMLGIYTVFGSLNFVEILAQTKNFQPIGLKILGLNLNYIDFIAMSLFIGCMGKSAQIGLHIWLPDAMEGPTPVSALIHAATMVTAGIFLVVRLSGVFELSQFTLNFMTIIGAVTCIFAATIAMTQNDIKKVIAYSTCSQLGYMFFACGVSAYAAGMFHLVTHAFFKALLFLAAGNVIIAAHHEQDMRKMGGLWKKIPLTYILVWLGSLAIAGIPPFAGYFSKDVILEAAFMAHSKYGNFAYIIGIMAAFLTSFYSWRLLYLTFHGKAHHEKIHHVPAIMSYPLIILGVGAVITGYIGYKILDIVNPALFYWGDTIHYYKTENILEEIHHTPPLIKYLPLLLSLSAVITATFFYIIKPNLAKSSKNNFHKIYQLFLNKWYIDEIYAKYIITPYLKFAAFSSSILDKKIIDAALPNGCATITRTLSRVTSKFQTGFIYHYALVFIIGLVALLTWIIIKNIS